MSLFPKCTFRVRLADGVVRAGSVLKGDLLLDVPEPIPRAEHLDLVFRTVAVAGYGGGKTRTVVARNMVLLPMHIDFDRDKPLAAGHHTWPFALEMPAWLPPNYHGSDCSITSQIDLHLEVDWALDPKTTLAPFVVMAPVATHGAPLTMRSPVNFHEHLVVEVTLDSGVIPANEPITGRVALRGGHDARFDALVIAIQSLATISMASRDRRFGSALTIRIPQNMLRSGESVPFAFPPNAQIKPTFRNGFIDHDVVLRVTADIPWASDPSFETIIQLLPAGSTVTAESAGVSVGAMRLRQLATGMATETGLALGRLPILIEGPVGPALVRITDSPRNGVVGVDVDIEFPDIDLGIAFRPVGMLDGFRESPLLPAKIGTRYLLRANRQDRSPAPDDARLAVFVQTILAQLEPAEDIRFSDHHLGAHFVLGDDGPAAMNQIARFATARAKQIADAISALPFPPTLAASNAAWRATATEQNAFLVPHVPAIHGIVFRARVLGGEARAMAATLRTVWRKGAPIVVADVDLREAPLPKAVRAELEAGTGFAAVRSALPVIHATTDERASLEAAGWATDPRPLLAALEQFFDAVLDARGERRTDSPYR